MDLKKIYINKQTKELQFIYLPIEPLENGNLIELMEAIVSAVKSDEAEGQACILRFVNYYRSLRGFDINLLEQFVEREDRSVVTSIRAQNSGQSGYMTNKLKHFYDKQEENVVQESEVNAYDEATGLLTDEDEATGLLIEKEEATGLLAVEDETTLLFDETVRDPFLAAISSSALLFRHVMILALIPIVAMLEQCTAGTSSLAKERPTYISLFLRFVLCIGAILDAVWVFSAISVPYRIPTMIVLGLIFCTNIICIILYIKEMRKEKIKKRDVQ